MLTISAINRKKKKFFLLICEVIQSVKPQSLTSSLSVSFTIFKHSHERDRIFFPVFPISLIATSWLNKTRHTGKQIKVSLSYWTSREETKRHRRRSHVKLIFLDSKKRVDFSDWSQVPSRAKRATNEACAAMPAGTAGWRTSAFPLDTGKAYRSDELVRPQLKYLVEWGTKKNYNTKTGY